MHLRCNQTLLLDRCFQGCRWSRNLHSMSGGCVWIRWGWRWNNQGTHHYFYIFLFLIFIWIIDSDSHVSFFFIINPYIYNFRVLVVRIIAYLLESAQSVVLYLPENMKDVISLQPCLSVIKIQRHQILIWQEVVQCVLGAKKMVRLYENRFIWWNESRKILQNQ